MATKATAI